MKVKLDEGAYMPERAHDTDAGLDLKAREDKVVPAGGSAVFDTGVHVELPMFTFSIPTDDDLLQLNRPTAGMLVSKSGLNVHHHITSTGLIDVGYNGSIRVKLYNHGTEDYHVKRGDKISQLVILPILTPEIELTDTLEPTERNDQGFGSTGR